MDSLDEKIIQILGKDARQSSDKIARQLGTSSATVRRRVIELIRGDVLRIVGLVEPKQIGFSLVVVVAFDVDHDKLQSAMKMLASHPQVKWVSTTTGRFDIIAMMLFHSTTELAEFMQDETSRIDGLRDSETFVCLQIKKGRYMIMNPD